MPKGVVIGHIPCICGEMAEVREGKGRLVPHCPKCSMGFQSRVGQATLREKMQPLQPEPVEPEITGESPVIEPEPLPVDEREPEPVQKPEKVPFRLFSKRG